jgi:solute carrier family 25 carnitine/acylcarnitine transporter 20/29
MLMRIIIYIGTAKKLVSADGTGANLSLAQYYAAGSLAAIPITIVETPVDLFKCKLQAQVGQGKYSGVIDAGKQVVSKYGIRGAYQGFVPTMIRNIPCFGAYFWGFEAAKKALTPEGETPSLLSCFIAGGFGGFSFWGVFYPLETIKVSLSFPGFKYGY